MKVKKFQVTLPVGATNTEISLNDIGDKGQGSVVYQVDTAIVSLNGWKLRGRLHTDASWVDIIDHTTSAGRLQMVARVPHYRFEAINSSGSPSSVSFYLGI